jgi:hypothetical protein
VVEAPAAKAPFHVTLVAVTVDPACATVARQYCVIC